MTLVSILARSGAANAQHLASVTGRHIDDIYAELVREEAADRVRILIDGRHRRTWEALVSDNELPKPQCGGVLDVF